MNSGSKKPFRAYKANKKFLELTEYIGLGELNKYTSKFDKVLQELDIEYFGSPLVKAFFDEYMGQITKNYS